MTEALVAISNLIAAKSDKDVCKLLKIAITSKMREDPLKRLISMKLQWSFQKQMMITMVQCFTCKTLLRTIKN